MNQKNQNMTSSWPESRMVRTLWDNFQEDLLDDILAFRPLAPLRRTRTGGKAFLDRLGVRWLPHAFLVFLALCIAVAAMSEYAYSTGLPATFELFFGLAHAVPLIMTMIRPVLAWWVSLGAMVVSTMNTDWNGAALFSHLCVMIVITLRSRPRVAIEMWVASLVVTAFCETLFIHSSYGTDVVPLAFFAAFALATALAVRGWALARGRVEEQETLVADVRGQHTQLEERARIARELHDVVAHHMSVIAIQAEAAPYRVTDPPEELTTSFATIRESAVIALAELRRVLGVLRFEGLDAEQPDAPQPDLSRLGELIDGVRAVGLSVELSRSGAERPMPQGVELSAYRIVQEALSNALRHAPGSEVRVEVSYVLTGLGLRVVNTAPTGKAQPSPGMGHGVMGMRERAAMLGGELTAEPTPDGGYEVTAFLPLAQGDDS